MWKSGIYLRDTIPFFPQEYVKKEVFFPQEKSKEKERKFLTENLSTFHSLLLKTVTDRS